MDDDTPARTLEKGEGEREFALAGGVVVIAILLVVSAVPVREVGTVVLQHLHGLLP